MSAHAFSATSAPALTDSFSDALAALGPFSPTPHLAVALSGGPDSMALTLLAQDWVKAHGGRLTTLTVDHALRAESRHEAEQVAQWMQARGIAHHILTPPHAPVSNNLLEAARQWRYDALADWCQQHSVLHCLLAHHADDQHETIAINTARGVTADGTSGMPMRRNYHGVRFLRPLLGLPKAELLAFLQAHRVEWIEDPSNRNVRFARARLRAKPVKSITGEAPQRRARDSALAEAAVRCVALSPLGYAALDVAAWCILEENLRSRLLADLLTTISGRTSRPRQHETERLVQVLLVGTSSRRTLHGCLIEVVHSAWHVMREPSRVAGPVQLSGKGDITWDNRFHVHFELPEDDGLTLRALGPDAAKQLPRTTYHVPRATPSLWHLDTLLYVPHIFKAAEWPPNGRVSIGFAPAKPLAAAPFW